jgi:hypothetical protein
MGDFVANARLKRVSLGPVIVFVSGWQKVSC